MPRHLDDLIAATRVDVARIFLAIGLEQRLAHRLGRRRRLGVRVRGAPVLERRGDPAAETKIGRASCRERVCQYVQISVVAVSLKKKKTNTMIDSSTKLQKVRHE